MNAAMPDLSGLLGALLANPAAIEGLLSLIGNLRSDRGAGAEPLPSGAVAASASAEAPPAKESEAAESGADGDATAASAAAHLPRRSLICEKRKGLLGALRPYLSPERCRTVDTLIRVSDLVEAFRETEHHM
jgi:hypothetical protein